MARERDWNDAESQARAGGRPPGDLTILPKAKVRIFRPAYGSKRPLVFRPIPIRSYENEENDFERYRLSGTDYGFGDWIRTIPTAKSVGTEKKRQVTFLLFKAGTVSEGMTKAQQRFENPYALLYSAARQAEEDESKPSRAMRCRKLLKYVFNKAKGRGGAFLPAPSSLTYMQALVYQADKEKFYAKHGEPYGLNAGDMLPLIQLGTSPTNELRAQLELERKDWDGSKPGAFEKRYRNGDPVGIKRGRFIHVFDRRKMKWNGKTYRPYFRNRDGNDTGKGYGVGFKTTYGTDNLTASLEGREEEIRKIVQFWADLLYFPTVEEQCLLIAKAFPGEADLISYAWTDHPEFFTEEVSAALKKRKQVRGAVPSKDDQEDDMPARGSKKKNKKKSRSLPRQRDEDIDDDDDRDDDDTDDVDDDDDPDNDDDGDDDSDDDSDDSDDNGDDDSDDDDSDDDSDDDDDDDSDDDDSDDSDDDDSDDSDDDDDDVDAGDMADEDEDNDDDPPPAEKKPKKPKNKKGDKSGKKPSDDEDEAERKVRQAAEAGRRRAEARSSKSGDKPAGKDKKGDKSGKSGKNPDKGGGKPAASGKPNKTPNKKGAKKGGKK